MNEIKTFAPFIVTTLYRYDHLKKCIDSLSRCTYADKTDLYIGLDYPSKEFYWEGYNKISSYVGIIKGFKTVTVIKRESNFGAGKNMKDLKRRVLEKYDRYIQSEDDNEFSPNFLDYINKGLEKYKDDDRIFAICGFAYPQVKEIPGYTSNIYPIKAYTAWGVGIWKHKYEKYYDQTISVEAVNKIIHSHKSVMKLFKENQHIAVHRLFYRNKSGFGDLMWRVHLNLSGTYCISPLISKVKNNGFDGTGIHCKANDLYNKQVIDTSQYFEYSEIEIKDYKSVKKAHDRIYGGTWLIKRLCEFEYFFYRIFGFDIYKIKIARKIAKKYLH